MKLAKTVFYSNKERKFLRKHPDLIAKYECGSTSSPRTASFYCALAILSDSQMPDTFVLPTLLPVRLFHLLTVFRYPNKVVFNFKDLMDAVAIFHLNLLQKLKILLHLAIGDEICPTKVGGFNLLY